MNTIKQLLGPMAALANIKPPGRSYADVRRFLRDCEDAGLSGWETDRAGRATNVPATPLTFALLRLYRMVDEGEERGIPYQEAEIAFNAAIERDRQAHAESMRLQQEHAQRARAERNPKSKDDELFRHAKSLA